MKYKGIELKEVTGPQFFNPPKKMLVWDHYGDVVELKVYAIVNRGADSSPVICQYTTWKHCAEIPESKPVTYRELARWLSEGNGEVKDDDVVYSNCNYYNYQENNPIKDSLFVRKWDDTEWHKPTREYLGLKDKLL